MKKKIILLLLLLVPFFVKADVAAPENDEYDVEVVEPGGINYYKYGDYKRPAGTLNKGTTLTIYYQMDVNGEIFLAGNYKKDTVLVKAEDVVAKGKVDIDDSMVMKTDPTEIYIDDEVVVRAGPSEAYEEVGRLSDVYVKYKYFAPDPMYYYVDKDGVKGWVYAQKTYVNRGTVVLYDDQETSCGTIKGSTVIGDFFERDEKAFFEYDGKECKLEDSRYKIGYAFEIPRKFKAATSLGEFNGKEVKKGTEFIGYASIFFGNGQEYTFVKIDGKFGWIETNYKTATYIEEVEDDSLEKEAKKHKKEDKKEEKEEKEDKKTDSKVIVLSCVIAGVGLVLGSLTALILFNRKKKGE